MRKLTDIEEINILEFPVQDRQATSYTCGAECVVKIMQYYGADFREMDLARILESDPENGTYVSHIVDFFHSQGLKAVVKQKMTIRDLIERINRDIPVIIMIQAGVTKKMRR
jgi:ABC-type bacteriocin/lantibiotic exporter with double-glycine peptidase domain